MTSLDTALSTVDSWPVPTAAAAIVTPAGVVAAHGPTSTGFPLASVTKPLTALAALVAVEEGAVELTDPADDEVVPGATIRHLLAHASGLAPERPMRSFPPATRRIYSNVGINRLALLVEQAVDMPFAAYLTEAVVTPLRLHSTTLPGSAAAGGVSTVDDLARVAYELLAPSGLLHPETLADATSVQYPGLRGVLPGFGHQDPNDWGLGLEIRGTKHPHWTGTRNSPRTYGHFGQSGSMMWIDPVAGVGLVALADRAFGEWAAFAWPTLADAVLTAL
ncbi:MAG TPA: serine hydrolase domain-containing protein [Jatrophihabitantaceae bacterium]|jgi:CubicO group peptidase (beta-lactamase class C family)